MYRYNVIILSSLFFWGKILWINENLFVSLRKINTLPCLFTHTANCGRRALISCHFVLQNEKVKEIYIYIYNGRNWKKFVTDFFFFWTCFLDFNLLRQSRFVFLLMMIFFSEIKDCTNSSLKWIKVRERRYCISLFSFFKKVT